ncbi:MAG: hypothetical protein PHI27_03830 [Eubacteriales bacterium]|nr:hypothetical protein [Eubacteriales bacterium]MDD3881364.1 hypothetical protein [Eubacteriales bacterium]MDD4513051.1 hypothetical protein [Eubacteriales bacterium]
MLSSYSVVSRDRLTALCLTSGDMLYCVGSQNGLFPEVGETGERGGVFLKNIKLADGFYFAVEDVPLTEACAYRARPFENEFFYKLPDKGLVIRRTQFVPDMRPGMVIDISLTNLYDVPRYAEVSFTVRTELMDMSGDEETTGDIVEYDERSRAFFARNRLKPYHIAFGAQTDCPVLLWDSTPEVYGFGNTAGHGANGRLFYRLRLPARGEKTLRLFIAGSRRSRMQAEDALDALRGESSALFAEKSARYTRFVDNAVYMLPDPTLMQAIQWAVFSYDWLLYENADGRALLTGLPENPTTTISGTLPALPGLLALNQYGAAWNTILLLENSLSGASEEELALYTRSASLAWRFSGDDDSLRTLFPSLAAAYKRLCASGARSAGIARAESLYLDMLEHFTGEAPETERAAAEKMLSEFAGADDDGMDVEKLLGVLEKNTDSMYRCMPIRPDCEGDVLTAMRLNQIVYPVLTKLCGVEPNTPKKEIRFSPSMPLCWNEWEIRRLRLGRANLKVSAARESHASVKYDVTIDEDGWTLIGADGSRTRICGTITVRSAE